MTTAIVEQTNIEQEQRVRPALSIIFEIGDWRVMPELNRLQHSSTAATRQLEPRLINLLCFLAANSDKVLSREELIQELWPHVVVNENSLTRAISELRKQLRTANASIDDYIETIPKRGYRLIPPVNFANKDSCQSTANSKRNYWNGISQHFSKHYLSKHYGSAITAACFSLVMVIWLTLGNGINFDKQANEILLSDEVLEQETDFLGGKVTLSMLADTPEDFRSMTNPVLSINEMQYAFIQYDSKGSTIFLGDLGTTLEPVPVFNSTRRLFNLTWSPVGNNLLFAMKPSMTTAAVYSTINANETTELFMLNLQTLEISRLVRDTKSSDKESSNSPNLT